MRALSYNLHFQPGRKGLNIKVFPRTSRYKCFYATMSCFELRCERAVENTPGTVIERTPQEYDVQEQPSSQWHVMPPRHSGILKPARHSSILNPARHSGIVLAGIYKTLSHILSRNPHDLNRHFKTRSSFRHYLSLNPYNLIQHFKSRSSFRR